MNAALNQQSLEYTEIDVATVTTSAPVEDAHAEDVKDATTGLMSQITLAGAMRVIGGGSLLLGLASYLLAGVSVENDLQRFLLLLVQTGVFAVGAFTLQRLMNDGHGARLLLGIALMSVPAGFAVLGAMIYGWMPLDGPEWLNAKGVLRTGSNYPG